MTPNFFINKDEEPMATEPIYLSIDESEYSTANTTPDHHHESIYIDSINHLIASQLEQRSNTGTETIFYPPTPNTSKISDDEEQSNLTPKKMETPNNLHCLNDALLNDAPNQYNFANMCSLSQTCPNHHPRKIKVREKFCVPKISPTHRHQHH